MSLVSGRSLPHVPAELHARLEKLARHYDVETMKVFMVVEALGEASLHAVYTKVRSHHWHTFLSRQEACRLDLTRHERTRERYQLFLNKVGREDQSREWLHAMMCLLRDRGAADVFGYVSRHNVDHRHGDSHHPLVSHHRDRLPHPRNDSGQTPRDSNPDLKADGSAFCLHLAGLFEKKLSEWFESFQAVAVELTAHVKVSGLVRLLSGRVDALCTRQGRLHALVVKVTAQETPRPLDVAELCLAKVMVIQNGLALPEDVGLALLVLHLHAARPVLRLWLVRPTPEMETAIRLADVDDMIDAGRLSQRHELWLDNTTVTYINDLAGMKDVPGL